jgi:hypothetical protein
VDGTWSQHSSVRTATLSNADTETAAIARLHAQNDLLAGGDSWSEYQPIGVGSGQCAADVCCRATWGVRGAGQFSFPYQESRYRVTSTGNAPGWPVRFRVRFYRKATTAPASAYALYAEATHEETANGDGKAQATGDVPIAQGYDTYVHSCVTLTT